MRNFKIVDIGNEDAYHDGNEVNLIGKTGKIMGDIEIDDSGYCSCSFKLNTPVAIEFPVGTGKKTLENSLYFYKVKFIEVDEFGFNIQ